jgi:hypothetical protein
MLDSRFNRCVDSLCLTLFALARLLAAVLGGNCRPAAQRDPARMMRLQSGLIWDRALGLRMCALAPVLAPRRVSPAENGPMPRRDC